MNGGHGSLTGRIAAFSRARRALENGRLAYRLGCWAAGAGILGLLALSGHLPTAFLNLGLALILGVFLFVLAIRYALRRERFRSSMHEAFVMEALEGDLESRLISALDFADREVDNPMTLRVIEEAQADLVRPFEARLDRRERNLFRKRFIILLAAFLALGFTPWFHWSRVGANLRMCGLEALDALFPVRYDIFPKPGRYVHKLDDAVEVGIRFQTVRFPEVTLLENRDQKTLRTRLKLDASGIVRSRIASDAEAEMELRFEFGRRRSEAVVLVFTRRPLVENMQTELLYPDYTQMQPRTFEGVQDRLAALKGTQVSLGFSLSKPIESAVLTWDDGGSLPLDVVGRFAHVSFIHSQARQATFQVRDLHGLSLERPLGITFDLLEDAKPEIILPGSLKSEMPFPEEAVKDFGFQVGVQDDFGVTRCVLRWRKTSVKDPSRVLAKDEIVRVLSPSRPKAKVSFEKIFANLGLQAGDRMVFDVAVFDNRSPDNQQTVSPTRSLFVYSADLARLKEDMLQFAAGALHARVPKEKRAVSVKEPEQIRVREKARNEFEAERKTSTRSPILRGQHWQAARDYLQLISTGSKAALEE